MGELPRKAQVATIRYTTDTNLLSEILKDETIDLGLKSVIAYNSITTDEMLSELVGLSVFSDTNKYGKLMEVIANHPNAYPNTRHKITEKILKVTNYFRYWRIVKTHLTKLCYQC